MRRVVVFAEVVDRTAAPGPGAPTVTAPSARQPDRKSRRETGRGGPCPTAPAPPHPSASRHPQRAATSRRRSRSSPRSSPPTLGVGGRVIKR
jgi:hypothetical protein